MKKLILFVFVLCMFLSLVSGVVCNDVNADISSINLTYPDGFVNESRNLKVSNCWSIDGSYQVNLSLTNGSNILLGSGAVASVDLDFVMKDINYDNSNLTYVTYGSACRNFTKTIVGLNVTSQFNNQNFTLQNSPSTFFNDTGLFNTTHTYQYAFGNLDFAPVTKSINTKIPNSVNSSVSVLDGVSGTSLPFTIDNNYTINLSIAISRNSTSYVNISFERNAINVTNISSVCDIITSKTGNCTSIMNITNLLDIKLNDIPFRLTDQYLDNFNVGMNELVVKFNLVGGSGNGDYEQSFVSTTTTDFNRSDFFQTYNCLSGGALSQDGSSTPDSAPTFINITNSSVFVNATNTNSSDFQLGNSQYTIGSISTTRDVGASSSYQFIVRYTYNTEVIGGGGSGGGGGGTGTIIDLPTFLTSANRNQFDLFYLIGSEQPETKLFYVDTNRVITRCEILSQPDDNPYSCFINQSQVVLARSPFDMNRFFGQDKISVSVTSENNEALTLSGSVRFVNFFATLLGIPMYVYSLVVVGSLVYLYVQRRKFKLYRKVEKINWGDLL